MRSRNSLGCVLISFTLAGCHGKPLKLEVRKGCKTPEVVHCLQQYAFENLSSSDVEQLVQEGIGKCLALSDKDKLNVQKACLPLRVGIDKKRRSPIEVNWTAGEVRPDSLLVDAYYAAVPDLRSCCDLGGDPVINGLSGHDYSACIVAEHKSRSSLCNSLLPGP